ncbi:HAMP domain-containing sensor histidine kinase [Saccharothrix texasensis]|uniref:Signal transduction histidine-protein kinase/phosphatase MprB n=1 Tax=Saccharothrix texasensis TaxID=103734 RepID=A0A3N1H6F1_9PSEU|nr:HAMP domain-containing sensor histidine kinase [Saccharothrix texasensis]ROP38124.1 signal transduction histidine kinase [Saccharothrix texasensis]
MKRTSLAFRITALCLAVAAVAVVVAGLVSARLVLTAAREVSREALADQADVVAEQLDVGRAGRLRVVEVLRGQGIAVVLIGPDGGLTGEPRAVRAVREAGVGSGSAGTRLVEVRPGVALVQETGVGNGPGRKLLRNIAFALGVGLLVAAVAGLLLGKLVARPLRRTAAVARTMSGGRRDLRAPERGPAEVAEVGGAVNALADALARSEARQREFLLSVSHELRTPLTAVSGFAESLADGVVSGPEVRSVGRTISREAHRLDRLVTDLLDLARLGADDFRVDLDRVDLTEVVTAAAEVWRARCAAKGVEFRLAAPPGPTVRTTDARRVRQVLDGLLENALRLTPAGRPVVLALDDVLQVRDGGPGLSEEDYRVAFRKGALHAKYERSRPVGTGVGLALVHGLVTRLGGTIEAGPAPEGGAAFTVRLPHA